MNRIFILTLVFLLLSTNSAFSKIDIVYPTNKVLNIKEKSIFFVGNTDTGANLFINKEPVTLWENNFFVKTVPLEYGKNIIELKSIVNGIEEVVVYTINRTKTSQKDYKNNEKQTYKKYKENEVIYTKTIKENSTVRAKSTINSKRIVDLPVNTILYLEGKKNDFYKIKENGDTDFWIHKNNIKEPVKLSIETKAKFLKQKFFEDENYNYNKIFLSHPVLYTTEQKNNKIYLTLYGVENINEEGKTKPNLEYIFEFSTNTIAYDCYYEDNTFIFRTTKTPKVSNINKPLKDVRIFVDAGHGGSEKGAIGPTRINEKDINLSITNFLISMLEEDGANVTTSRTTDTTVDLYERVKIAKNNNAQISISIHNNSLPNGKDPYETHGTEVHYYNENAKLLAEIINKNLACDLSLKNGGTHKSSFVLNRSTAPISVLIEVAYMINPTEYILLRNKQFQRNVAKSIKNSLAEYILSIQE